MAEITGLDEDKIRLLVAAVEMSPVSFDSMFQADEDEHAEHESDTAYDRLHSSSVEASLIETRIKQAVANVFDTLPEIQQAVIALRYYEGMDLTSIATSLELSLTSVRSMHSDALLQLHAAMISEAS